MDGRKAVVERSYRNTRTNKIDVEIRFSDEQDATYLYNDSDLIKNGWSMKLKFKIDDIVKYNGNIYQIVGFHESKESYIYDVKCLKNNFPDEPVSISIGSCAEDKMELVDFNELSEKQQWIEKACEWLKEQDEMVGISFTEDFIARFQNYMKG